MSKINLILYKILSLLFACVFLFGGIIFACNITPPLSKEDINPELYQTYSGDTFVYFHFTLSHSITVKSISIDYSVYDNNESLVTTGVFSESNETLISYLTLTLGNYTREEVSAMTVVVTDLEMSGYFENSTSAWLAISCIPFFIIAVYFVADSWFIVKKKEDSNNLVKQVKEKKFSFK